MRENPERRGEVISQAKWIGAEAALRDAISRFATQSRFEPEFFQAVLDFWGVDDLDEVPFAQSDLGEDAPEFQMTFEWYIYDYRESGSGEHIIDLFAQMEGEHLPAIQRTLLEQWRSRVMSLYEVLRVRENRWVDVLDVVEGGELTIDDEQTAGFLQPGDVIAVRLLPVGEYLVPASAFRTFTPADLPRLTALMHAAYQAARRDHPDMDWSTFLRKNSFLFNDYALQRQLLLEVWEDAEEGGTLFQELAGEEWNVDERQLFEENLAHAYQEWVDRPTPALDGMTPRQAAGHYGAMLQRLKELITALEVIETSFALVDEPYADLRRILEPAGIPLTGVFPPGG